MAKTVIQFLFLVSFAQMFFCTNVFDVFIGNGRKSRCCSQYPPIRTVRRPKKDVATQFLKEVTLTLQQRRNENDDFMNMAAKGMCTILKAQGRLFQTLFLDILIRGRMES